ncbi:MAG: ABC transporter permease [Proteobacteria bacterium]|nr:ABC transporter permease [Pseudomonadota bacterium]MBI3498267.1 ABC transporter permease [Pseudomonadota bacterium]
MTRGRRLFLAANVAIYAFILSAVVFVILLSFSPSGIFRMPPEGVSLVWYRKMLAYEPFWDAMTLSLIVAVGATATAMLLGLPAALALVRYRFPGRDLLAAMLMAPIVVPAIILGVGLLMLYTQFFIENFDLAINGTVIGLLIGHAIVCLPWIVRVLIAGLQGLERDVEEAAMNLGARPLSVFWHVTLPLLRPAMLAAGIFAFIASFGNLEISLMLSVPGTSTLPVVILIYLDNYNDPSVAALSTLMILGTAGVIVLADRWFGLAKLV